jgi:hypothetical protein
MQEITELMAIWGYSWPFIVTQGHSESFMVTRGLFIPLMGIHGHLRPLKATQVHSIHKFIHNIEQNLTIITIRSPLYFSFLDINSSPTITNLSIKKSPISIRNLFLQKSVEVTSSHHHLVAKPGHSISRRYNCENPNSICRDLNKS